MIDVCMIEVCGVCNRSIIDALCVSTYPLNALFVLMQYTIPFIFRIVVRQICEGSQARSTITTSPTSYYSIRGTLLRNVRVHSFISVHVNKSCISF